MIVDHGFMRNKNMIFIYFIHEFDIGGTYKALFGYD
jgi:hypothetical protein